MNALIVRPFGIKEGIDFDRVESELLQPVLALVGIEGRTSTEIASAGSLRTDTLERLLVADVVIADLSVNNANVFYELGIRHALRDRVTIVIRAQPNEVPFGLLSDRSLAYDAADPAAAKDTLRRAIESAFESAVADSPVFRLLPSARPQDPDDLRAVPGGFREEVQSAADAGDRPKLALLADEARETEWLLGGLRLVAGAQIELEAWGDLKESFEAIRRLRPDDLDANLGLGSVLRRLGDLPGARAALARALALEDMAPAKRAEAYALSGSIAKTQWHGDWRDEPSWARAGAALRSAHFETARGEYDRGFLTDQNHWFAGLNALALATIELELAGRESVEVGEYAESAVEASTDEGRDLTALRQECDRLAGAVSRSLKASRHRSPDPDAWRELGTAELTLLTTTRPALADRAYRRAQGSALTAFPVRSAAAWLQLYSDLGVLEANVSAALAAIDAPQDLIEVTNPPRTCTIVFSGHRIDPPGRTRPRFPAAAEATATRMIRSALEAELRRAGHGPIEGLAGGANGGDIIFHEQCAALGISSRLLLALPQDAYAAAAVADGGPDWLERFRALFSRRDVSVLSATEALPDWLASRDDYSIWERGNRWLLHSATSRDDSDVTLVVLWDAEATDGTAGLIALARDRGVRVVQLDANELV